MKGYLPERFKIVNGITAQASSAARTGDYISLKDVNTAYVIVTWNQAGAGDAANATIYEATSTTGGGAAATTGNAYEIWSTASTTSDTLTHQTASYRYSTTTDATTQLMVFQVRPEQLTDTYDCINVITDSTSTATNYVCATYLLEMAYQGDQPPSVI